MYKMYFFLSQWKPIVTKWTLLSYIHYMEETEKLNTKCQLGRDKFPIFPIICQYLQGTVNIYYKYFEVIKQLVIRALNRFVLRYLPNLRHLEEIEASYEVWGLLDWDICLLCSAVTFPASSFKPTFHQRQRWFCK